MPKKITPESSLLKACTDLLTAERIWWMRMNIGAMRDGRRFVRFGKPGTADILASLPAGLSSQWRAQFIWIECKTAKRDMTPQQHAFRLEVKEQGHVYLLIRDVDELRTWLKEYR